MFSHAASQSLPLCFLSKKKRSRWKKRHIRPSGEIFFLPSSKVAGIAVPAFCHMKDPQLFSLCSSTVQFFFMLPVMQKKIGVQKGPV